MSKITATLFVCGPLSTRSIWRILIPSFLLIGTIGVGQFIKQTGAKQLSVETISSPGQESGCNSFVQQQKLTRSDSQTNTNFGASVAISGDLAVVGNPEETINGNSRQGSAHIFVRSGTTWSLQQKLIAPDGAFDDRFGIAVSISNDTVVIGALLDDVGASSNQGSAYVFTRSGTVWSFQQKLTAADGTFGDHFGGAVALSGNTIAVGASLDDPTNQERGSAYVFVRSGTVWSQQQKLIAADGNIADHFGIKVTLEGDTAVIGATGNDVGVNTDQGAAYVFVRSGVNWSLQQKLTASDGSANEFFGNAIAISGDTVAIGLPYDLIGANTNQGSVYVFVRSDVTWSQQQKIVAADGSATDYFGGSVAIDGNTLVVEASGDDIPPFHQGSVYLFTRSGANWSEQQQLTTADGYGFGSSVLALNAGTLVVGSPSDNFSQGAAYVFTCSPCPSITLTPTTLPDNITIGVFYSQNITPIGGTGSYSFTVKTGVLPSGLTLSSAGVLSGTPNTLGYVLFSIQTTDSNGCSGTRAYALNVVPSCGTINLLPTALSDGRVGMHYFESITVTGGQGNYTFSIVAGALPNGISINLGPSSSSFLIGTPTNIGVFNFVVKVTDSIGCVGTRNYSITIKPQCPDIMINPAVIPNARVGVPYSQSLEQTAGALPVTWSLRSGGLPTGLTLNPNTGLISGTPTTPTTFPLGHTFIVRVVDANQCIGERNYELTLFPPCSAITVNPATLLNGFVGTFYNQQLTASGGAPGYSYTVSSGALPAGLTLSTSGYLSGTPSASGNFNFTVQSTDNNFCTGTRSYSFYISPNPGPPLPPKLLASDGLADDQFGYSVALSGNTAICGAHLDDTGGAVESGSAYIFVRNGAAWTQQQKLTANDAVNQDFFGTSVAISGDTAFVGAYKADISGRHDQGAVYVFLRNGTTWTQQQKLFDLDEGAAGDNFGKSLAISGDTLVIGATGANANRGATYVFVRSGTDWIKQQRLISTDGPEGIGVGFGIATAISGDTVLIGASGSPVGANALQGSAYVFTRTGTIWTQQQKLLANDGADGDAFGNSVALDGGTALIGAFRKNFGANLRQGAAYIFVRSGTTWAQQQKLVINNGAADDAFGASVALNGGVALVGANGTDAIRGAAYVYLQSGSSWTQQQKLTAYDSRPFDNFGNAVALNGNLAVIGAVSSTGLGNAQTGAAYIYVPICPNIAVNPATSSIGTVGAFYSQTITSNGGTAPYSFYLTAGVLPAGIMLSPTGGISGTPSAPGSFPITITTADANGCQGAQTYTLIINPAECNGLTLNPATLGNGNYGQVYSSVNFSVSGGTGPYTFNLVSGALPNGLILFNGVLSGTPAQTGSFNFTLQATTANGCIVTRSYTLTVNNGNLQFYPLAHPVRLLDTRVGATGCDLPGAMISGGTSRTQTAAGRTCDGLTIPANAKALTGNVTTVLPSVGGFLTLYPNGVTRPLVSNSNYASNSVLNNVFTVGLGAADGAFNIYVASTTDVVVDVTGYYAPPSASGLYFHPLPHPVRLMDSRVGATACFTPGTLLTAGSTTTQLGTTTCDGVQIPGGALALVGNATTVNPQANGFLTLFPADAMRPLAASSNFQTGINMNAPFTVGLSPSGQFNIYTAATTDLVIDVLGYFSAQLNDSNGQGLLFNPLPTPVRLLDTRAAGATGCFTPGGQMIGGTAYLQPATGACTGIPAAAKAVVGNATTVNVATNGFLTFWPSDANQPTVATSNYRSGLVFNRHFTAGLGTDGAFKRFASTTTDLVVDLSGYFAP